MDKPTDKHYDRAASLARWSYIGLFIPVVGIIMAGVALSTIKDSQSSPNKIEKIRRIARLALLLSILVMTLILALIVWGINALQDQTV